MIRQFRHKGLQQFFETGSLSGINAGSAPRLRRMLDALDVAGRPEDVDIPGWRLTFMFEGQDVVLPDLEDYHG